MHGDMKLRSCEIDDMTLPEAFAALDEDLDNKKAPRGSMPFGGQADMDAYAAAIRSEGPRAKFERAKGI